MRPIAELGEIRPQSVALVRSHIKQALAGVQAYVWPAMGNTQNFPRG